MPTRSSQDERDTDRVTIDICLTRRRRADADGLLLDALLDLRDRVVAAGDLAQLHRRVGDRRLVVLDRDVDRALDLGLLAARILRDRRRAFGDDRLELAGK